MRPKAVTHWVRFRWLVVAIVVGSNSTFAQEARIRLSNGPHYVKVPIDIQVIADGFDRTPEPSIEAKTPNDSSMELIGVSPNISSSIQIINGQMTRTERVRFAYNYRLVPNKTGTLQVAPFRITQGRNSTQTDALNLIVEAVPTTSEQRFRLILPEDPLWVGQRVPVGIEWWLSESFAQRLAGHRASIPLFNLTDHFKFEDLPSPGATSALTVDTTSGTLELPATVLNRRWQDEPYLIVTARRSMIALKAGKVTIEPSSMVIEEATRWSTDLFGTRVPANVRRVSVYDETRELVFKSPPTTGRPLSFSGAIGRGFSLEVSADRSVVQVGDPIRLTIDIRGDTVLDRLSLPGPESSGLNSRDFNTPDLPVAGITEDGVKRFIVTIRVVSEGIKEIPSLAFSWFDPDVNQYKTTYSRPIALSVGTAITVSAADVITAQESDESISRQVENTTLTDTQRPSFTLTGADLSIETKAEILLKRPWVWYAKTPGLGVIYILGLTFIAIAIVARRRASVDPKIRARRGTLEMERHSVAKAERVEELSRALRRIAAVTPALPRNEYDALLAECDNLAYAPGTGDDMPVDAQLRSRVLAFADEILEAFQ